jgi:hypothetical protein
MYKKSTRSKEEQSRGTIDENGTRVSGSIDARGVYREKKNRKGVRNGLEMYWEG